MLCQQGDDAVFCGVDADFLDRDGIFAIKYRHDMEKTVERHCSASNALAGTICEKRTYTIPSKKINAHTQTGMVEFEFL